MLKKGIGQILADTFDIPLEGIADVPSAQIIGNTILNIDGCIGIKKYETTEIIIRSKEYIIKILGDNLSMLTFSQGRVCVRGNINAYEIEELK